MSKSIMYWAPLTGSYIELVKNAKIRGLHPTNSSSSNDANLKREYQISFQDSNEKFLRKFQNLPTR